MSKSGDHQKSYCYFISGSQDITSEEFDTFIAPRIDSLISMNSTFVICDGNGVSALCRRYLAKKLDNKDRVTVYHMRNRPRHGSSGFPTCGGFETDEDRDAACTRNSDRDLVLLLPGGESSNVSRNLLRRQLSQYDFLGQNLWTMLQSLEKERLGIHETKTRRSRR